MRSQTAQEFFARLTNEGRYRAPSPARRGRAAASPKPTVTVAGPRAALTVSPDTGLVIDCIIKAYANSGLKEPGAGLRAKITRATNTYAKTGVKPTGLMTANTLLGNPAACLKGHVEGVTFFNTATEAQRSPLYLKSLEVFGKKATPAAFAESRIRAGQTRDQHRLRTADSRVGRLPSNQAKQRGSLQGSQSSSWANLMAKQQASRPRSQSPRQQAPRQQVKQQQWADAQIY